MNTSGELKFMYMYLVVFVFLNTEYRDSIFEEMAS